MTKMKFFAPLMVATFVAAGYVGYGAYSSQSGDDALLLENVEALTRGDVATSGYSNTHIPCYDVVHVNGEFTTIENGKYQGVCWINPNSKESCHEHSCSSCRSI